MSDTSIRLLVAPQGEYNPWQHVYSLIGRLPDEGVHVEVATVDNRIGEMVEKACDKHGYTCRVVGWDDVLELAEEWPNIVIAYFDHESEEVEEVEKIREVIRTYAPLERMWYVIMPDTYDENALAIETLTQLWKEHGAPRR